MKLKYVLLIGQLSLLVILFFQPAILYPSLALWTFATLLIILTLGQLGLQLKRPEQIAAQVLTIIITLLATITTWYLIIVPAVVLVWLIITRHQQYIRNENKKFFSRTGESQQSPKKIPQTRRNNRVKK